MECDTQLAFDKAALGIVDMTTMCEMFSTNDIVPYT